MKSTLALTAAAILALTSAVPTRNAQRDTAVVDTTPPNGYGANFKFPLANGFPSPKQKAIDTIAKLAGGSLPNGPAPPNPGATGALDLMVIATNELTEVAFFTELLHNVTSGVDGYTGIDNKEYVIKSLQAIKNVCSPYSVLSIVKAITNTVNSKNNSMHSPPTPSSPPTTTLQSPLAHTPSP